MKKIILAGVFALSILSSFAKGHSGTSTTQIAQPIAFTENKGQVADQNNQPRPDVLFSGTDGKVVYHLKNDGISYQLTHIDSWKAADTLLPAKVKAHNIPAQTTIYRLDLNWINANPDPTIEKGEALVGYDNYYTAACPNGATGVKSYTGVTYKQLYNGIDLKWYQKNGRLEYDYEVAPGADYTQIQLALTGAEKLSLNANGDIIMQTPLGPIAQAAPVVLQNGKTLTAHWVIKGSILSYQIEGINRALPFTIDPVILSWGTYYGGGSTYYSPGVYSCAADTFGNVYISGNTDTASIYIATSGAQQSTFAGGSGDAFLAKFDSTGTRQWGTYYGGNGFECYVFCATDLAGNVFLTAYTSSTNGIATPGSYQTTFTGANYDFFLAKFNPAGIRQWGTYYGGNGAAEYPNAICTDNTGNVFVAGWTIANSAIAYGGGYQSSFGGGTWDAFLVKFNNNGQPQWGTFYGGTGDDYASACAADASGNIYMGGLTNSATGIATAGSYSPTFHANAPSTGFLVKFNATGARQWATYYGDSSSSVNACVTDAAGNIFITGGTNDSAHIATTGSFMDTFAFTNGSTCIYLAKLNASGVRQWGTYFPGYASTFRGDYGNVCAIDAAGNVYITGYTIGNALIATSPAYQATCAGSTDLLLEKFNTNGTRQWGTYYGGPGQESPIACSVSKSNAIYVLGTTNSTTGVTTTGTTQPTYGGGLENALLAKFTPCNPAVVAPITGPPNVCASGSVFLRDVTTLGTWASSNNNIATVSFGSVTGVAAGLDTITYSVNNGCGTTTVSFPIKVNTLPTVNPVSNVTVCAGDTTAPIHFTGTGTGVVFYWLCGNSTIGLPQSGTNTLNSFTPINTGSTPVVATITVNPIAPAYAFISNSGDNSVFTIDAASETVQDDIPVGLNPRGITVSPDNTRVYASVPASQKIMVINTNNSAIIDTITTQYQPWGIVTSPDGKKLYVASSNYHTVQVINTINFTTDTSINVGTNPIGVAISADGSKLYVTNSASGNVSVINTATSAVIATVTVGTSPMGIAISPDGSRVYAVNSSSGTVSVINTATNTVVATVTVGTTPFTAVVSTDGSKVYVSNQGSNNLSVINTTTNTVTATVNAGNGPTGLSITADGSTVYIANIHSNNVTTLNTATNTITDTIGVGTSPYAFGNFLTTGNGCGGTGTTFTITVKPSQQSFPVAGPSNLCATGSITLTDTATGGVWNSINANLATVNSTGVVSGVAAGRDTISYSVSNGCSVTTTLYPINITAAPTVNTVTNQTVCAGDTFTLAAFTGTGVGAVYNWVNNNTGIGLAATGTGRIDTFIATNNGSTPAVANVTVTPITPAPGNCYITQYNSKTVTVINTTTNQITDTIPVSFYPVGVSVNPDGSKVYITNSAYPATISVISTVTNQVLDTISVQGNPTGIAVSPDGTRVYVANQNPNLVTVINATTDTVITTIPLRHIPYAVKVTPDGSKVFVSYELEDSVVTINALTNQIAHTTEIGPYYAIDLAISHDGSVVYVTNGSQVSVLNVALNYVSNYLDLTTDAGQLVLSPDGNTLYITDNNIAGKVSVLNLQTGNVTTTIPVGTDPEGISITPDGRWVYVVNTGDSSVSVINTSTNTVVDSIRVGFNPTSFGNFIANSGNGGACTGTPVTFNITVNPAPTATLTTSTGHTHFCQGDSLTVTAGAETGYLWSTGATTQSIVLHQGGNTVVTVTDHNGCTASTSSNISAFSVPTSGIVQSDTGFCPGDSVTLTSASQFQYLWSTGATTQNIVVKQAGNYFVVATNPVGCTDTSAVVRVAAYAAPPATISGPASICAGLSATLTASGGTSYNWSDGLGNNPAITVSPANHTTYFVTVTDAHSCTASAQQTVSITTAPFASITGPVQVCNGYDVILHANGGNTYAWSGGLGTADSIEDFPSQATTYTVTVSIGANCSATASQTVNVYPVIFTYPFDSICAGQTYTFGNRNLSQSGTYNDTLQTMHGCDSIIILQLTVNNAIQTAITGSTCNGTPYIFNGLSLTQTGIYKDTLPAATGCDSVVTLNLSVLNALQTAITDTSCYGTTYVFNGRNLTQTGIYKDTLQATAGCDSVITLSLWVDTVAAPTITRNGDTLTTQPFNSYNWLLNGTTATGSTQSIVVTQNGNYSVVVTGAGGCTDTSAILSVTTLGLQNVMSNYAVKLFPNPNTGNFTLQFTDDVVRSVEIADELGRTVVPAIKVSKQQVFNAEQLAAGVYVLRITGNNQTQSLKFSVMKP